MNILDENISILERQFLEGCRVRVPARYRPHGMADEEIIPFLHQHPGAIYFTSDRDFSNVTCAIPAIVSFVCSLAAPKPLLIFGASWGTRI